MKCRNNIIRRYYLFRQVYRTIYILVGLLGILIISGIFSGTFNLKIFIYYTVISNILCIVYFCLLLISESVNKRKASCLKRWLSYLHLRYNITVAITLTFLIYHFVLRGTWTEMENTSSIYYLSNCILHYIIPILTISDFLLFNKTNSILKWYIPFIGLIIPSFYLFFILIRASLIAYMILPISNPYPYPILDFTILSINEACFNVIQLVIFTITIGYAFMGIDFVRQRIKKHQIKLH